MKNCIECNYKFTMWDRLKSKIRLFECLQCPNCNSKYKHELTFYRFSYYFLAFTMCYNIKLNNWLLECILYVMIATIILTVYDVVPHKWHKYKKIS